MDKTTLSFEIPARDKLELKRLADSQHRSVSQQVRLIIEKFLEEKKDGQAVSAS